MPYGGDVEAEDATNEEFGDEIGDIEAEDSASESLGDDEDEHQEDLGFEAGDEEDEALLSMDLKSFQLRWPPVGWRRNQKKDKRGLERSSERSSGNVRYTKYCCPRAIANPMIQWFSLKSYDTMASSVQGHDESSKGSCLEHRRAQITRRSQWTTVSSSADQIVWA